VSDAVIVTPEPPRTYAMGEDYLRLYPSRHAPLSELGRELPAFVRGWAGEGSRADIVDLVAAVVAAAGLRYEVRASPGARELSIEARIAAFPDREGELSVDDGAEPFVRDVAILSAPGTAPIEQRGNSWFAPGCAARGCRIRYRFALREAAAASGDEDLAVLYGEIVESPPGAWLLRPLRMPAGATPR